jgi:SRSO17 transposase
LRRPLARRWINLLGDAASLQSQGEAAPTKYWLSTPPSNVSFRQLVDFAKLRWRIERDYQELKQEVGLGHYLATVD